MNVLPMAPPRKLTHRVPFATLWACVVVLWFAGCEKPPTFGELVGKDEKTAAPAPVKSNLTPVPAAAPVVLSPEEITKAFLAKPFHSLTDADLDAYVAELSKVPGGLESVRKLNLGHSKITNEGLRRNLGKFSGLQELNLSNLQFANDTFSEIAKAPGLAKLELDKASVTDDYMTTVARLENLRELSINNTGIGDNGIYAMLPNKNLEILKMSYTGNTGRGFWEVRKKHGFGKIRVIEANHTQFGQFGFAGLVGSQSLEELTVGMGGVTDGTLNRFKCPNLRKLDLAYNSISDFGVRNLGGHTKLTNVSLRNSGKNITDRGLSFFANCKGLEVIDVEGTSVTGIGARKLRQLIPTVKIAFPGSGGIVP